MPKKKVELYPFPTGPRPDDVKTVFDDFCYHELLDRAHCVRMMFYEMIESHQLSAIPAVKEKMEKVGDVLSEFYQWSASIAPHMGNDELL